MERAANASFVPRGAGANGVSFARTEPSSNQRAGNAIVMLCHRSPADAASVIVGPFEIHSPSRVLLLDDLMNYRGDQLTMLLEVGRGEIE